MTTTNMTLNALVSTNSALETIVENLTKGTTYMHTLDGALGIITKYWNKGFGDVAQSLGYDKPKDLSKFMHAVAKQDAEGVDSRMYAESEDKNGNVSYHWGTWGTKNVEDESVTIKDKKGNDVHPYMMQGKTVVQVDSIKGATNVTPNVIFTFIIQNQELASGRVTPQTDLTIAVERAKAVEAERIANANAKAAKKAAKTAKKEEKKVTRPTAAKSAKKEEKKVTRPTAAKSAKVA